MEIETYLRDKRFTKSSILSPEHTSRNSENLHASSLDNGFQPAVTVL